MAIHNAKDGREKWERQGIIDQDKPWCLVYEDVPDGDLRVPLFEAAGTVPVVAAVASGSPLWWGGHITPSRTGWYITRTENGFISWRAWGKGAWWKQIKGGWIESYTGDGCALSYDWQPQSRQSIDLDSHQLPDLANVEISHARERRTDKSKP